MKPLPFWRGVLTEVIALSIAALFCIPAWVVWHGVQEDLSLGWWQIHCGYVAIVLLMAHVMQLPKAARKSAQKAWEEEQSNA